MKDDVIRLVLPADPRYLDVAIATVEALADRCGVDSGDVATLRAAIHDVLGERLAGRDGDEIVLRYEVGDGFLGVRFEGDTSYAHT